MKANSIIRRGIGFLLLLIFFQQIGAGLFIHNIFHDKLPANHTPVKQNENSKEINFSCSCVDNFLTPFIESGEPVTFQKQIAHRASIEFYIEQVFYTSLIFSFLRGPPVLWNEFFA